MRPVPWMGPSSQIMASSSSGTPACRRVPPKATLKMRASRKEWNNRHPQHRALGKRLNVRPLDHTESMHPIVSCSLMAFEETCSHLASFCHGKSALCCLVALEAFSHAILRHEQVAGSWRIMACATSLGLILLVLILALSLTAFRPGKNQYYEISFQVVISLRASQMLGGPMHPSRIDGSRHSVGSCCSSHGLLTFSTPVLSLRSCKVTPAVHGRLGTGVGMGMTTNRQSPVPWGKQRVI